jgi:hypothetical protein
MRPFGTDESLEDRMSYEVQWDVVSAGDFVQRIR